MGHPTIYPTGVKNYNPEKCWRGLTVYQAKDVGAVLMDMNGRKVKVLKDRGCCRTGPKCADPWSWL